MSSKPLCVTLSSAPLSEICPWTEAGWQFGTLQEGLKSELGRTAPVLQHSALEFPGLSLFVASFPRHAGGVGEREEDNASLPSPRFFPLDAYNALHSCDEPAGSSCCAPALCVLSAFVLMGSL